MQSLFNAFIAGRSRDIDAHDMVHPDHQLRGVLYRDWDASNRVFAREMAAGQHNALDAVRRDAVTHTRDFYRMRMDPKSNAHYVGLDAFERTTPGDRVALRRQNSFLSIAGPLHDVDALSRPAVDGTPQRVDAPAQAVLEASLRTLKAAPRVFQHAACARARAGQRALPLTLDPARMRAYMAANEQHLQEVVRGCDRGVGNAQALMAPLHCLASDYLQCNHQLPVGLAEGTVSAYRGRPIGHQPITLFAGTFADTAMEYRKDRAGEQDALVLSIGTDSLSGLLDNRRHLIPRFAGQPPAQERAAFVLQSLFYLLTSTEELIRMDGLHARSEREQRENAGTRAEWAYAGSTRLGDATRSHGRGLSQRVRALSRLAEFSDRNQRHQDAYGVPLISDPLLANWIGSSAFRADLQTLGATHPRLSAAQIGTTAEVLLQTRAFGGRGLRG